MNNAIFSQHLMDLGIITEDGLEFIASAYPDTSLVEALEDANIVSEYVVYNKLADFLNIGFIDLSSVTPMMFAVNLVPSDILIKNEIVPISCDHNSFHVATSCPGDWELTEYLRFVTDRSIVEHACRRSQIIEMFYDLFGEEETNVALALSASQETDKSTQESSETLQDHLEFDDEDGQNASVKILNRVLKNAIRRNASDIHIEPHKGKIAIRIRIDGELMILGELSPSVGAYVISRIKVLSEMDISETSKPQDGNISVQTGDSNYDLRVSTVATPYGEKVVMRVLDPKQGQVQLDQLGLLLDTKERVLELSSKPQGLIIITGPTGSGKNTTLCSIINCLKSEVSNIVSVEDPIEYEIEGINQIGVNPKKGLTFPKVLRALLRQDPNIIYIGEIRDEETASIACLAAQTGHLVFSTLHTNDAASAVTRLLNMGVSNIVLADALTGVLAQRLSRRICKECGHSVTPTQEDIDRLVFLPADTPIALKIGDGCSKCSNTGYRGRIAVNEFLVVDEDIRKMITAGSAAVDINSTAREKGMRTMWETGSVLVSMGLSTFEEIERHVPKSESTIVKKSFPETILVVDDDPGILKLCQRFLESHECEVVTASDGDYAMHSIEDKMPDFVLTDLNMPRMDGYTLCAQIRQNPRTAHLPIIVMTGKGSTEEAECMTLEIGVNDFIRKPVKQTSLVARIRAAYKRHLESQKA